MVALKCTVLLDRKASFLPGCEFENCPSSVQKDLEGGPKLQRTYYYTKTNIPDIDTEQPQELNEKSQAQGTARISSSAHFKKGPTLFHKK